MQLEDLARPASTSVGFNATLSARRYSDVGSRARMYRSCTCQGYLLKAASSFGFIR